MIQVGKQIQKVLAQKPDFNLANLAKRAYCEAPTSTVAYGDVEQLLRSA